MDKKLIECWTHPIKSKIYFEISTGKATTAKMIASKHPHIPQATLYRYLKGMVEDGILKVAEVKQIRNLSEKTYALDIDIVKEISQYVEENPKENISFLILESIAALQNEFYTYFQKEESNPLDDGIGLFAMPFYASTDEIKECATKLQEVMKPYLEAEATPKRKLRNFVRIFTPPRT